MNISTMTLEIDMLTPSMIFTADYEMDGRILLVPLRGNGDCFMNISK